MVHSSINKCSITECHTDIHANNYVEDRLENNEAFFNAILENISEMIFVKDAKYLRFVRSNMAGESKLESLYHVRER